MDRRRVLVTFLRTMFAGAMGVDLVPGRASLLSGFSGLSAMDAGGTATTFAADLESDMDRLGNRVYSEQGIPMMLACEDRAAATPVAGPGRMRNVAFFTAFEQSVRSWQQMHADAPAADVARLVEVLAYRDLAAGGRETTR